MSRALDARNKLANTARHHGGDPSKIASARADLAEAKIADYIERMLAEAPPLTDEQRTRLAELLRPVQLRPTKDGWVPAHQLPVAADGVDA